MGSIHEKNQRPKITWYCTFMSNMWALTCESLTVDLLRFVLKRVGRVRRAVSRTDSKLWRREQSGKNSDTRSCTVQVSNITEVLAFRHIQVFQFTYWYVQYVQSVQYKEDKANCPLKSMSSNAYQKLESRQKKKFRPESNPRVNF
jgi:hypothetical protein